MHLLNVLHFDLSQEVYIFFLHSYHFFCPTVASTSLNPSKFYLFATTSPNNLICPNVASTSLNPSTFYLFATTSSNHLNCPTITSTFLNPSKFYNFATTSPNLCLRTSVVTRRWFHRPCIQSSCISIAVTT